MTGESSMEVKWRCRAAALGLDQLGPAARPFHILVRAGVTLDRLRTLIRTDLLAFKNLGEGSVSQRRSLPRRPRAVARSRPARAH